MLLPKTNATATGGMPPSNRDPIKAPVGVIPAISAMYKYLLVF